MNTFQPRLVSIGLLLLCLTLCLTGSGCKHTANGAGKDIEKMGEKIQEKTQ